METAEQIGYMQYWGMSSHFNVVQKNQGQIKVLLSATADLRHVLKTCLEHAENKDLNITFYLHEKHKEILARCLLLLLILHDRTLSYRERTDLFLEIYGNSLIRDKTQKYIDERLVFLENLITSETKKVSALHKLVDLSELKFKDRDELMEVIQTWRSSIPFNIEQLRDQRLRYHYKTRYDFRKNLIDWDYQMQLKDYAPIIHYFHYKQWRETGVAFESRYSTYPTPNRTLSSYMPGKKKTTRESCLVRGYWGDIVNSPYFSYGVECDIEPEKKNLFKVQNQQQVSHAVTVSEFNVQHMIQKLDSLTEYHIDMKNPDKIEEVQEDEEEKDDIEIPLKVFEQLNIKIVPIFEELDKLSGKKKFQQLFDVGVFGFYNSALIKNKNLLNLFKENAQIYVENAYYMVPLKKEEREKACQNILKIGEENGLKRQDQQKIDYGCFIK